jgi:hypothetical protein
MSKLQLALEQHDVVLELVHVVALFKKKISVFLRQAFVYINMKYLKSQTKTLSLFRLKH